MRRPLFPKRYADRVARLRVPGGFLLAAAFVWLSAPSPASLAGGLPLAFAGLTLRACAAGRLAKNERLATGGPYARVRNPLYLGTLIAAAGLAVASRSLWLAALFAAVFALVYLPVIELEEQHLRRLFPSYEEYARRVPMLWPRLSAGAEAGGGFKWRLYVKNEEYQAALGLLAAIAVLLWKLVSR